MFNFDKQEAAISHPICLSCSCRYMPLLIAMQQVSSNFVKMGTAAGAVPAHLPVFSVCNIKSKLKMATKVPMCRYLCTYLANGKRQKIKADHMQNVWVTHISMWAQICRQNSERQKCVRWNDITDPMEPSCTISTFTWPSCQQTRFYGIQVGKVGIMEQNTLGRESDTSENIPTVT